MEKVVLGTKVNRLGIPRLSVGEGSKCRAVFLDKDPRMKHIAFDDAIKRNVEVDQDMCIKYGLRPRPTFYYLVAKLNTDLNGTIIGDKFTVEYIQLSENLNNEFSDQVLEQGVPKSLLLSKVKKTGQGKDFSYLKVVPSQVGIEDNPALLKKINDLRENTEFIEACWAMIDADTSLNKQQYEKMLADNKPENEMKQLQPAESIKPQKQITSAMPQVDPAFAASNDFADFGSADDFEMQ